MKKQKQLSSYLDNKKTKQPLYLSTLTIQSPTNKYFFKNKGQKTIKGSETNKTREISKNHQIKIAVQLRFTRCRMNHQYKYKPSAVSKQKQKQRNSSHSSQMEQFKDLRDLKYCNLVQQNKKLNKREIKTGRSKMNSSSSQNLLRRRQNNSPVGMFLRTSKINKLKRQESPLSISIKRDPKMLIKKQRQRQKQKSRQKQRIKNYQSNNTCFSLSKYQTLSPYSRNLKKGKDQFSSEQLISRGVKSYSTVRLPSRNKKVQSSKMITLQSNTSKQQRSKHQKRKRMYSHQKL